MGEKIPEELVVVRVRFLCCIQIMIFEPVFDKEGFLICPVHHQRRYGWRGPRKKIYKVAPIESDPEKQQYIARPDYSETALEVDQAIVQELFGESE